MYSSNQFTFTRIHFYILAHPKLLSRRIFTPPLLQPIKVHSQEDIHPGLQLPQDPSTQVYIRLDVSPDTSSLSQILPSASPPEAPPTNQPVSVLPIAELIHHLLPHLWPPASMAELLLPNPSSQLNIILARIPSNSKIHSLPFPRKTGKIDKFLRFYLWYNRKSLLNPSKLLLICPQNFLETPSDFQILNILQKRS